MPEGSRPRERRGGRKPGVPNKTTPDVREAIAVFASANVERRQDWLDRVARTDPAKALELYFRAIEYHS